MWICPICNKSFRNVDQWHSCAILSVENHLTGKPHHLVKAVEELLAVVNSFEGVVINPVKTSIQVKCGATFLTFKVKKDHVFMEFQLGRRVDDFPIEKVIPISSKRNLHYLRIDDAADLDQQLREWLWESYLLVS